MTNNNIGGLIGAGVGLIVAGTVLKGVKKMYLPTIKYKRRKRK